MRPSHRPEGPTDSARNSSSLVFAISMHVSSANETSILFVTSKYPGVIIPPSFLRSSALRSDRDLDNSSLSSMSSASKAKTHTATPPPVAELPVLLLVVYSSSDLFIVDSTWNGNSTVSSSSLFTAHISASITKEEIPEGKFS